MPTALSATAAITAGKLARILRISCAVQVPNDLDQCGQVQVSQLHFLPATNLHLICLERTMSELKPLLLGSMFALFVVSAALAQVTIDVSKITCDQYLFNKVANAKTVAV